MKVVLDSNVLLSAFASRGLCESVFETCLVEHDIFISEHILAEVARHLGGKLLMPANLIEERVAFLMNHATSIEPAPVPAHTCRDKDDLPVLGTLKAASADCLVTGDADLLALREYEGRPIVSLREFHRRLSRSVDGLA